MANSNRNPQGQSADNLELMRQLSDAFEKMSHDVPLVLFARKESDDVFTQAARQVIRAFRQLTSKVTLREYNLGHELAGEWNVTGAPTLVIAPERYAIRWLGAPMGEEARTLLETILLVGHGKSGLSEESVRILGKLDGPRKIKVFVSPTCPYCPQQAVNAVRAAVERPDLISLEIVDIQCRPDLADQYGAHSVPQAFANDLLIGMGAQSEELFCQSLQKMEPQTVFIPESDAERVETDLLIVGGGPAGLTAGIYSVRSGLKTAVVEKGALGGQVALTPVVENYPGFSQVGGKSLVDIMVSHALEYVQIFQGEEVLEITGGDPFEVRTTRRTFTARAVLLATGASNRRLGVPGESRFAGRGVSYCSTCDGPLFKGKEVIMVGGGNSAVTEALHLHHIGVKVTLVHRRDKLRAQEFLAKPLMESGIPIMWNTEVTEIMGEQRVQEVMLLNNKTSESTRFKTDGVFLAIGYEPSVELAGSIGVALNEDGYIAHDDHHRTNMPGVYSAGDVEGGYKQIVTATGQGAAAAMTIFEDLIHPYWEKADQ